MTRHFSRKSHNPDKLGCWNRSGHSSNTDWSRYITDQSQFPIINEKLCKNYEKLWKNENLIGDVLQKAMAVAEPFCSQTDSLAGGRARKTHIVFLKFSQKFSQKSVHQFNSILLNSIIFNRTKKKQHQLRWRPIDGVRIDSDRTHANSQNGAEYWYNEDDWIMIIKSLAWRLTDGVLGKHFKLPKMSLAIEYF